MSRIVRLRKMYEDSLLPVRQKEGDSGADLHAYISHMLRIAASSIVVIPTGIAIELPDGLEAQVRPRSGLAASGVMVAFGTIDSGYRGEIKVVLYNLSGREFLVEPRSRIAQLVVAPVVPVQYEFVSDLAPSDRGISGMGSTGIEDRPPETQRMIEDYWLAG